MNYSFTSSLSFSWDINLFLHWPLKLLFLGPLDFVESTMVLWPLGSTKLLQWLF